MCLFYLNAYWLVPKLIFKKRYITYALSLVLLLAAFSALEYLLFGIFGNTSRWRLTAFLMFNLFPFLFIVTSGTAYRMFLDKTKEEKRSKEREAETLKSELSFLRSQISPHFMFNVINSIVALARKKSDLVEPSLHRLSSLMRYFLYESSTDKVPLEKEIEYLENYIALQQQRYGDTLVVNLDVPKQTDGLEIEPMLLIPFVENAFKHGVLRNATIDVVLHLQGNKLRFSVSNRYQENSLEIKDPSSGIGLPNVKRRLDLLYGHNHSLLVSKKDGKFIVSLELTLNHDEMHSNRR